MSTIKSRSLDARVAMEFVGCESSSMNAAVLIIACGLNGQGSIGAVAGIINLRNKSPRCNARCHVSMRSQVPDKSCPTQPIGCNV